MGVIGCPILEDELVYSLCNDREHRNLFVVDGPVSRSFRDKLSKKGLPFTPIDGWEFDNGFVEIDETAFNIVVIMNKLGLHSDPKLLRKTLEDQLIQYRHRFDSVALYYGMCGNAMWDVSKWASASLNRPVFVFRDENDEVCDDCIGVAVGGHSCYCDFVRKHAGMLFVTPAIAGNWKDFSKEMDMVKGYDIMDIHTVKGVFELFGYKYMVKIDTGIGISGEELEEGFRHVSEITGLEMTMPRSGSVDLYPAERLYSDAKGALMQ
jgi:hypothetical protein